MGRLSVSGLGDGWKETSTKTRIETAALYLVRNSVRCWKETSTKTRIETEAMRASSVNRFKLERDFH